MRKCVLPEGLAEEPPKMLKIQECLDPIDFTCNFKEKTWFYPFPHAISMRKTSQMHLNTSPTCFDGRQGREMRFSYPVPQDKVKGPARKLTHKDCMFSRIVESPEGAPSRNR